MAEELTINVSAEYLDADGVTDSITPAEDMLITLVTAGLTHIKQNIGTSEEALNVGDISSRGFCIVRNLDPTNFVEVRVATSGAKFAKLFPKGSVQGINFCVVHLGSGAQTPYAIADTAACDVEIFLCAL